MICVNCGYKFYDNEAKECLLCGMKYQKKCTICKTNNPIYAKFCFECGNILDDKVSNNNIKNYQTLNENRKNVAVIFADISGFTKLSEKMDPEEVRDIINDCFSHITKPVYELGGTIDKYIGDCVMILFGAKNSHSDDPKRAVLCGIKMLNALNEFNNLRLSNNDVKLNISIGINYGLVVTGSVGNLYDKDYTVMGDVVNTAQRLQSIASENTIYVSESIYLETKNEIDYSNERIAKVKNKTNPIKYYVPNGLKEDIQNIEIPLFDRENEIEKLKKIYFDKKVNCVKIVGEKGIGKTSLVNNFIKLLSEEKKKVFLDLNYNYKNRVNYLLSSILLKIMNINLSDTNRKKRNRLLSFIDYVLEDFEEKDIEKNANFLKLIIGLDRDNEFQSILNSMNFKDIENEIVNQLTIFFKSLSKKQELIIVLDNIQWADKKSLEILNKLFLNLKDEKIFFILTSRYNIEELSYEKLYKIYLENLNHDSLVKLSSYLFKSNKIDNNFIVELKKISNGNPLYAIEIIKSIKRNKKFDTKDGIINIDNSYLNLLPNSLDKIVLENISEVDDDIKKFLQIASIIGKEFSLTWVKNFYDGNFDDEKVINSLIKQNIIKQKSTITTSNGLEKIFSFTLDITREVIYNSILNKYKLEVHKKIAEFIENKYTKEIENYYELLCYHYKNANLIKKEIEYYYKTAKKYKNDYSFKSAIEYFLKFIEKVDIVDNLEYIDSLKDIGHIYTLLADYDNALDYLNKALVISKLSDDLYSIKILIANIYKEQGKFNEALELIEEIESKVRKNNNIYGKLLQLKCNVLRLIGNKNALKIALESEEILLKNRDYENLAETMNQAGIIYFVNGDIENSLFYLNKAYNYSVKVNNLRNIARVSGNLGIIYHAAGMISKALLYLNKSKEISEKISYIPTKIASSINLGVLYMEKGLFNKAYEFFMYSLNKSKELSMVYQENVTLANLGDLMYEKGDYEAALNYFKMSGENAKKYNLVIEEGNAYLGYAKIYLEINEFDNVIENLEKAYDILIDSDELSSICDYYFYKSIYELKNKSYQNALNFCEKAINISTEVKNDMKRLRILRLKGDIFMRLYKFDEAIKYYSESIKLSIELESDYELSKGYYSRFNAYKKMNEKVNALSDLRNAKETIKKVDDCKLKDIIL